MVMSIFCKLQIIVTQPFLAPFSHDTAEHTKPQLPSSLP